MALAMVLWLVLILLQLNRGALSPRQRAVRLVTALLMGGLVIGAQVAKRASPAAARRDPPDGPHTH